MGTFHDHAVVRYGSGETAILLAPDFGCSQKHWDGVRPLLADENSVFVFDVAGSGAADPTLFSRTRHANLFGFVDDLIGLLSDLSLTDVIYLGHSNSGMIGLLASIINPQLFRGIVTICTSARYTDDPASGYVGGLSETSRIEIENLVKSDYATWVAGFAPTMMYNSSRPELTSEFISGLLTCDPAVTHTVLNSVLASDYRSHMARVPVPVLVLQSTGDPAVPETAARWLASELPHGSLEILPELGHFPHVIAPAEIARHTRTFIAKLS